jgi:hypothetical protein
MMSIPLDIGQRIDAAEKQLERLLEWISRLDTKFNIILGVELAMLGVLATSAPAHAFWSWLTYLLFGITVFFIGSSLYSLYQANRPYLVGPKNSLIFFSSVANLSIDSYRTKFFRLTQQEYLEDLLTQCR